MIKTEKSQTMATAEFDAKFGIKWYHVPMDVTIILGGMMLLVWFLDAILPL